MDHLGTFVVFQNVFVQKTLEGKTDLKDSLKFILVCARESNKCWRERPSNDTVAEINRCPIPGSIQGQPAGWMKLALTW